MTFWIQNLIALVLILTVHEWAHAIVARQLGDPTAEREGRVSLNPLMHLDPVGTFMLFVAGFGWGKPVPVNPRNFKNPIRDEALTALAGPVSNLIMAFAVAVPIVYLPTETPFYGVVVSFLQVFMQLSLVLSIFNLLPIPPLDGSKFVQIFLPFSKQAAYQRWLRSILPYALVFMVVDFALGDRLYGGSLIQELVGAALFWMQALIFYLI